MLLKLCVFNCKLQTVLTWIQCDFCRYIYAKMLVNFHPSSSAGVSISDLLESRFFFSCGLFIYHLHTENCTIIFSRQVDNVFKKTSFQLKFKFLILNSGLSNVGLLFLTS